MRLRQEAGKNCVDHSFKPKILCECVCVLSVSCLLVVSAFWALDPVPTTYDMSMSKMNAFHIKTALNLHKPEWCVMILATHW